jgi:hypothetical protein
MDYGYLAPIIIMGSPTAYMWWLLVMGRRSKRWPTAPGVVLESKFAAGSKINTGIHRFRYEYRVNGERYTGDRVCFGYAISNGAFDVRRAVSRYPPGRQVEVRYHPWRPSLSTLEPRMSGLVWMWLILGTLIMFNVFAAAVGWIPDNPTEPQAADEATSAPDVEQPDRDR